MTLVLNSLHKIQASPTKQVVVQVPFGETVTLVCDSNDAKHSFIFWFVNEKNIFVGPSYHYDNAKFKYEVLSGNLTVKVSSRCIKVNKLKFSKKLFRQYQKMKRVYIIVSQEECQKIRLIFDPFGWSLKQIGKKFTNMILM